MRTANRTPVNDLSCESVDTEARSADYSSRHCEPWDERTEEDSRGWSYIECVKCEKCGAACTKMIGHSSFILKGSSWSRDGYK